MVKGPGHVNVRSGLEPTLPLTGEDSKVAHRSRVSGSMLRPVVSCTDLV